MASITKQRIGKYTYLYESISYRDEKGRPRNRKSKIGKIDPDTGATVYIPEYLEKNKGIPALTNVYTTNKTPKETKEYAEQFFSSVKCFGVFWFLQKIAEKIGLWNILQQTFPHMWQEVFTLASYLVVADKPFMYCEDWLAVHEWLEVGSMAAQRISELLIAFNEKHRNQFYKVWSSYIQEHEYLALDITSISSYSQQITDCEWGHNRDNEKLPQINLCLLYGEETRLPVFQTNYTGSLGDVSTLENTISEFRAIVGEREIMTVMDKGFYSAKNINMMIEKKVHFLVAMSFTNKLAKQMVDSERKSIDQIENVIKTKGLPIRGVYRECPWANEEHKLHAHIYFDPEKSVKERNELYDYVTKLKGIAVNDDENIKYKKDIQKYLELQKSENGQVVSVNIRKEVVDKSLENTGWFVLLSNHIDNTQNAFDIYRMKDVVEKGFWKYKNSLGLERLRVHNNKRVENKTFVAFIALILSSYIHNVMRQHELFKNMTFDKLFIVLEKIKSATIDGHYFIRPLTKQIKDIFGIFQIPLPSG